MILCVIVSLLCFLSEGSIEFSIAFQDARTFAEDNGLIFAEVSAKTGMAVNEVFMTIGESAYVDIVATFSLQSYE